MIGVFGPALFASLVWIRVAFFICLILLSIGTFVSVVSVVICMRRIAERGRDEGLADACRSLAALVIMAGICWIAGMLLLPFLALPSTSAVGVLEVCMGVLIIAGLVGSMLNYALSLSVLVALKRLVKGVMEERGVAHADGGAIDQFEADGVGESDDLIDGRS
jgi:hypothetical protein